MFKRYMFLSFSQLFFPFFLVLLFIASVVLIISIAGKTYVVKMSFFDLFALFAYSLPGSMFFIISITFFASLTLGIARLSYEYEMMVFFALGIKPVDILKTFLPITILATCILLVFSLVLVPLSNSASKNFIAQKRADIDVNLRAGELGQKLGEWLVYVDEVKDRKYKNLILYSQDTDSESFVVAQDGRTRNQNGLFELLLERGDVYFAQDDEIRKIVYDHMNVRQILGEPQLSGYDLLSYWQEAFTYIITSLPRKEIPLSVRSKERKISQAILVSVFPIVSLFLVLSFGIANPRFKSNMSYFYVIGATALYFVMVYVAAENFPFLGILFIPTIWLLCSYLLYAKSIKRYY
ncbi:LptF/LptG family permease [uncultured Helicobacter sp.]|uniref:LptF/LptG family permease n=1 Tax=uncultured Helicobacter sp. TaxID=175537 RepID=UPI001C3B94F1|nr:LptF/LptG family permease [Candidatus Helicobacter avicola]